METHEQKTSLREIILRAVAVLGLIAVLLLGAWGIIQLAVSIPTLFGSIGNSVSSLVTSSTTQKESLTVSSISTISSGQTLQVSWEHKNKDGEYSYSVSYACQKGLSVKALLPTGNYQTVACDTPFNFVNASTRTTIIPTLTGTASTELQLTVSATKLASGAVTAQGTATTNVAPAAASAAASPKTATKGTTVVSKGSSTSYYAAPVRQTLYGYGDLAVTINSIAPAGNGLTAVTFTIANIGTNSIAGGWMFTANLPVNGTYQFMSQPQRALNPGDKIVYTLTYSGSNGYPYANGYGYTANGYYTAPGYTVCS